VRNKGRMRFGCGSHFLDLVLTKETHHSNSSAPPLSPLHSPGTTDLDGGVAHGEGDVGVLVAELQGGRGQEGLGAGAVLDDRHPTPGEGGGAFKGEPSGAG